MAHPQQSRLLQPVLVSVCRVEATAEALGQHLPSLAAVLLRDREVGAQSRETAPTPSQP